MLEKDRLIDKLYSDNKDLHLKVERLTLERIDALTKFSESEKYWRQKLSKQERERDTVNELTH